MIHARQADGGELASCLLTRPIGVPILPVSTYGSPPQFALSDHVGWKPMNRTDVVLLILLAALSVMGAGLVRLRRLRRALVPRKILDRTAKVTLGLGLPILVVAFVVTGAVPSAPADGRETYTAFAIIPLMLTVLVVGSFIIMKRRSRSGTIRSVEYSIAASCNDVFSKLREVLLGYGGSVDANEDFLSLTATIPMSWSDGPRLIHATIAPKTESPGSCLLSISSRPAYPLLSDRGADAYLVHEAMERFESMFALPISKLDTE